MILLVMSVNFDFSISLFCSCELQY